MSTDTIILGVISALIVALIIALLRALWKKIAPVFRHLLALKFIWRLHRLLTREGLTTFVASRKDYKLFRPAQASIPSYVSTARRTLEMVSMTLITSVQFEDLTGVLRKLLERETDRVRVCLSLLNPRNTDALKLIAPALDRDPGNLRNEIAHCMKSLLDFRVSLSAVGQASLCLRFHPVVPCASAILIDVDETWGALQLETKAYKMPFNESFGFELHRPTAPDAVLYRSLVRGYRALLNDGELITEASQIA